MREQIDLISWITFLSLMSINLHINYRGRGTEWLSFTSNIGDTCGTRLENKVLEP